MYNHLTDSHWFSYDAGLNWFEIDQFEVGKWKRGADIVRLPSGPISDEEHSRSFLRKNHKKHISRNEAKYFNNYLIEVRKHTFREVFPERFFKDIN